MVVGFIYEQTPPLQETSSRDAFGTGSGCQAFAQDTRTYSRYGSRDAVPPHAFSNYFLLALAMLIRSTVFISILEIIDRKSVV